MSHVKVVNLIDLTFVYELFKSCLIQFSHVISILRCLCRNKQLVDMRARPRVLLRSVRKDLLVLNYIQWDYACRNINIRQVKSETPFKILPFITPGIFGYTQADQNQSNLLYDSLRETTLWAESKSVLKFSSYYILLILKHLVSFGTES